MKVENFLYLYVHKSNYQLDQASMSIKDKQKAMTTEDLCKFLKDIGIEDDYIELFKKDKTNGCELATYDDNDLKDLGITQKRIRKKILARFKELA